jgi:CofD-related protein of GAK system
MEEADNTIAPVTLVKLNHPVSLPVHRKVEHYAQHPLEGPPITLLSGGSGARALSETLMRYTYNSAHVLPMFDDGGSSKELRQKLHMPPPGDLRNRLMALSDMSYSGNPEVSRLFRTRLPAQGAPEELQAELDSYLSDDHPQMSKIERRYRRIIMKHLERFNRRKPPDFDLSGGNIGNFVIAGSYLSVGDLESVIFEFSALAAVRGYVYPVCTGNDYHLKAEMEDGSEWIGQSRITSLSHPPIRRLAIVERQGDVFVEVQPQINPLAEEAVRGTALITYTMGSFYTSIVSNLLVAGMGRAIRETRRPKVFVANLLRDKETPSMTVGTMLQELYRYLSASDPQPGAIEDYVQYVLVNNHGDRSFGGRVPVDLDLIRRLGVEPIVLPLEQDNETVVGRHDVEPIAAVLISLC